MELHKLYLKSDKIVSRVFRYMKLMAKKLGSKHLIQQYNGYKLYKRKYSKFIN